MNKIYRIVWNAETGQWVVASEMAKGRKKASTKKVGGVLTAALLSTKLVPGVASASIFNGQNPADGQSQSGCDAMAKDGSGYWSTVTGCSANGNGFDAATLYGWHTIAGGSRTVVVGNDGASYANDGTALGTSATVTSSATNAVALGAGSVATEANTVSLGRTASVPVDSTGGSDGKYTGALTRRMVNMSAGTADTDAVNVGQLKGVTTALGGGAAVNPDGTIKAPAYDVNGTSYSNVGGAVDALDNRIDGVSSTVNNINNGAGIKYFHANSTLADSVASAANSVAIGGNANATGGNGAIAIGSNASAQGGDFAGGSSNVALGAGANADALAGNWGRNTAIGGAANANTTNGVAVGYGTVASGNTATALGYGAKASAATSLALGSDSVADRASGIGGSTKGAVSIGSGGAGVATDTRQIISVARGTQDTDAVNLSQLKGVTTAMGGGTAVNSDGTIKAPSYTVNGNTYNNVGDALTAAAASGGSSDALNWNATTGAYDAKHGASATNKITNVKAGTADTDAVNLSQLKAAGMSTDANGNPTNAFVAYDSTAKDKVTLGGTGGTTITNVKDGSLAAGSKDAVNGGQLYAVDQKATAAQTTINNITNGAGIKYFHANSTAADSVASAANSVAIGGNANATGGNGAIAIGSNASAQGGDYAGGSSNVALGAGANADATTGNWGRNTAIGGAANANTTNGVAVGYGTVASGNTATALGYSAKASAATSLALGSDSVADRASGIGGSTKGAVSIGSGGAGVATDTRQIISVARGTQDTDAVNLSQLKGVTTAMGGGTAVNSDGSIKAPSYTVNGNTYNNVGDAITAAAASGGSSDALNWNATTGAYDAKHGASATNKITNVKAGTADTDAVNLSQLKAAGMSTDANGTPTNAFVAYDSTAKDKVTLGGTAGTTITNVKDGSLAAGSKDAVNGGQLYAVDQKATAAQTTINNITNGAGIKYFHANSTAADSTTTGAESIGIGGGAKAVGTASIAMGNNAQNVAGSNSSIAIGGDSKSSSNSVAIGNGADTSAQAWSTAVGLNAKVSGVAGTTLGENTLASGDFGVALGSHATASSTESIAIGHNSVADRANSLSVGSSSMQRQIIQVAKGTADTDAVNVSQLKGVTNAMGGGAAVNPDGTIKAPTYDVNGTTYNNAGSAVDALDNRIDSVASSPLQFAGNNGANVTRKLGDTLAIKGLGSTAGTFSGANLKTVTDPTTGAINLQMADSPKFGNIVVNDAGGALNMGGGKITNLADGTAATDAATKGQMDAAVAGAGKWKLQANGGTAKTITSSDTVNLVDGKNTKASFDTTTNQMKVDVVDAPTFAGMVTANGGLTVGAGQTVNMGGNKVTNVAAGTAASDAVNFGQLSAAEKSVADALGGGSKVDPTTGKISEPTYAVDGKSVNGVDGAVTALDGSIQAAKNGINGLNAEMADAVKYDAPDHKKVTFGTAGTPVVLANVADGSIASGSKEAVNGGQLFDMQNTLTDKGLVFGGNTGGNVTRKLGETLAIKGTGTTTGTFSGANLKTVTDPTTGAINLQMADSPKFGNIVVNDAGGALNMGGGKVTNLADGTAATDAATKGQVDKAIADVAGGIVGSPLTFAGNTGSVTRKLGDTVTIKGGNGVSGTFSAGNITTEAAADGSVTIKMADAPKFGNIVVNDSGKISGVTAGTAAGDVATFGQLSTAEKSVADAIGGGATVDPATGKVTPPTFTITDKDGKDQSTHTVADAFTTLDGRVDSIDGRVTVVEGNVTNIMNGAGIKYFHTNSTLADSQAKGVDSVAIGGNAIANAKNSVALGSNSTADRADTVSVGTAGAERQIVNVKAGVQQTDAVNVSQLKGIADAIGGGTAIDPATGAITPPKFDVTDKDGNVVPAKSVADAIGTIDDHVVNVDNRVTNIEGNVTNIIDGKAGLVQQDETSRELTVGKDTDGKVVDFTNKNGEARVLDGVAGGDIAAGSTQAINGGQAHDIAQSVADSLGGGSVVNPDGTISTPTYDVTNADGTTSKVDGVNGAITNLDGRVYQNTTDITNLTQQISDGSVGLVQYDDASGTVTVAAGKGGTKVDFANADGQARQLKSVAAGGDDTDAVNVSQLKKFADAMGGGTTVNPDGTITGPTYYVTNVDGTKTEVHNAGDAFTTIDGRVTNMYTQINQGTVGLVQQAAAGEKLTVGKDTDGTEVNFTGTAGDRKLSGVADGVVSETSHDAVNGSQLHTVAQSVADAMGGGSTVNPDGSVTAPVYNVTNVDGTTTQVQGVEGAVTNLDQRTYSNTTKIENITNQINSGSVGLVKQDEASREITVAKGTDGKSVNIAGTQGDRTLAGVAAGKADNEAVNVKQLKDAGIIGKDGTSSSVVTYDDAGKSSITMGGQGASTPVAIHNVADGVADRDAVNVSQLNQRLQANNTEVLNQANSYTDKRINDVWQDLGDSINQVNQQANRGIAAASALVNVTPYLPGKTAVNAGVASYRGEAALGVGVSRWSDNGRVNFNAGVSASKGDQPVFRVGVGYVF